MNILEAMQEANTGKRFKRKNSDEKYWLGIDDDGVIVNTYNDAAYYLCANDVFADNWEVEEKTTTITEQQLEDAFSSTRSFRSQQAKLAVLKQRLGL